MTKFHKTGVRLKRSKYNDSLISDEAPIKEECRTVFGPNAIFMPIDQLYSSYQRC